LSDPSFPNYFFFGGCGIGSPHIIVYPEFQRFPGWALEAN